MDQLEEMRPISRELWRKSQEDIAHKDDGAELEQACPTERQSNLNPK